MSTYFFLKADEPPCTYLEVNLNQFLNPLFNSGRTPDAALGMAELGQQLGAGLNLSGHGAGGGGQ